MNNKGFAVSSVLYTILICFLMFLGAAMAMFSSSNSLVVSANDDIINGTNFSASRVMSGDICVDADSDGIKEKWNVDTDILIKINSRYGIKYWPRDFLPNGSKFCASSNLCVDTNSYGNKSNYTGSYKMDVIFKDEVTHQEISVEFKNPCR